MLSFLKKLRIRQKLTLQFILIVSMIVGVLLLLNFQFLSYNAKVEFENRLKTRAELASSVYIKKYTYFEKTHQSLVKQYNETPLPGEILQIFDAEKCISFVEQSLVLLYPDPILSRIKNEGSVKFMLDNMQCFGLKDKTKYGEFILVLAAIDTYSDNQIETYKYNSILFMLSAIAISGLGGYVFAGRALQPVGDVVHQVQNMEASNMQQRVDTRGSKDEIGELGDTFNSLLNRVEESFASQKNFLSNASHELRTPLTAIIGELEVLLMKDRTQEEYKNSISQVHQECEQLKEMLNLLLNINFIENQKNNNLLETIRIDELVFDLMQSLAFKQLQDLIQVEFDDLPEDEDSITVRGNKYMLTMVIKNLFENALKFSDYTKVNITIKYDSQFVSLLVKDKGIGIAADEQLKVFQTFYRAENAMAYKGSGIGLVLCQKIAKLHRGKIELASKINEGTTVKMTLPNLFNEGLQA